MLYGEVFRVHLDIYEALFAIATIDIALRNVFQEMTASQIDTTLISSSAFREQTTKRVVILNTTVLDSNGLHSLGITWILFFILGVKCVRDKKLRAWWWWCSWRVWIYENQFTIKNIFHENSRQYEMRVKFKISKLRLLMLFWFVVLPCLCVCAITHSNIKLIVGIISTTTKMR